MRTIASGWCPKHDDVYPNAERCPRCGTTLVPVEPPAKTRAREDLHVLVDGATDEPLPVASRPRRWKTSLAISGALVAAFLLGLTLPGGEHEPVPEAEPPARFERSLIGETTRAPNGAVTLVELGRDDDRVVAVFRTGEGFDTSALVQGAAMEVTTRAQDGRESRFSLSEARVTPGVGGFGVTGRLEEPGTITEVRISSIQVQARQTPEWSANISSMWPVRRATEPQVARVRQPARAVVEGSVRLTALLGWSDRLEAVFELRGLDGLEGNRSQIVGVELLTSAPGEGTGTNVHGRSVMASDTEQASAGQMIARFESVPDDAGTLVIRAYVVDFIGGPWVWTLA